MTGAARTTTHAMATADFPSMVSLDGRVALVTGASRGLGLAMATALAHAGADVVLHGATSAPSAAATALTDNATMIVTSFNVFFIAQE